MEKKFVGIRVSENQAENFKVKIEKEISRCCEKSTVRSRKARKSRHNLTFIGKIQSGNGGERGNVEGNGVRIMREEMSREDNKESSSQTNHSHPSRLEAAGSAPSSFLPLTKLLWLFIHVLGGQVKRKSHFHTKTERVC